MASELDGKTIAFLVAPDGAEQIELTEPWEAIKQAGGTPQLISTKAGQVQARNHLDRGDTFPVDGVVGEVSTDDYDALLMPGGVASPDHLRMNADAVAFTRAFFEVGKPVAAICHAPWTIVEAGTVESRTLTSYPSLRTDIRNAGGSWVDEEVVVDSEGSNTLVTSRGPDDLKAFCQEAVAAFAATG
jgi:protease I